MDFDDVQKLEYNAAIRIKFASINDDGGYRRDASEEYLSFFPESEGELEGNWFYKAIEGEIEARSGSLRHAWVLNHGPTQTQIVVVGHETGMEILVAIGISAAGSAIVGLSVWAWRNWRKARSNARNSNDKVEPSIEAEKEVETIYDNKGTKIKTTKRVRMMQPLSDEQVRQCIENLFGD